MNIIHICLGKANPNRMNGVNKFVHSLATQQQKLNMNIAVWGITKTLEKDTFLRKYPLRIFHGNARLFKMNKNLKIALKEIDSDTIIHFHGVMTPIYFSIARQLKKQSIRWVVTPHGAYNKESLRYKFLRKWLYILVFDQYILRNAHKIHVGILDEFKMIRWLCKTTPVVAIKNAQELPKLSKKAPNNKEKQRALIFGYIGRLEKRQKGLDILLNGFSDYLKKGGQGYLYLIGDGPDRRFLTDLANDLNMSDRVVFHGAQFAEEKKDLIKGIDVFVHTSRWEVNPLSVMEAASLEKPLLISQSTNMADEVESYQAGFVLTENNQFELSQCMLEIDHKKDCLKEIGKNARRMIKERFDPTKAATAIFEKVYKN